MTTRIAYGAALRALLLSARLGDVLSAALATSRLWMRRRHDRHALSQLDTHMLRDIGFDHAEADEMARPFWRA